mgnify:CR=1 FL=1
MNKSGWTAFLLSIIPGAGHLYLYHHVRAAVYFILFFVPLGLGFFFSILTRHIDPLKVSILFAAAIWVVNKFDMIFAIAEYKQKHASEPAVGELKTSEEEIRKKDEKTSVMLWSLLLPGSGHLYLGLMIRGLTFLISFFGVMVMIIFVTAVTDRAGFAVFLGILPVIWIFCLFDALHLVNRKHNGEILTDRSVFEDFEGLKASGRKSKLIAHFLSIFPGASHMYLGLQKRGLQFMAAFLFSIYILDVLRLSIFLFLIPIIWFYSFFDALQHISKYEEQNELKDVPVVDGLVNHRKWLGIGLLLLGSFYLFDQILLPLTDRLLREYYDLSGLYGWYYRYFQTTVVSAVLIGIGLKLLIGRNRRKKTE